MSRIVPLTALTMALWVSACSGQTDPRTPGGVTVDPRLVRGAAAAPVTIVEFSDYQ